MARLIKFTEDDLKPLIESEMRASGFLRDDEDIDGFLYSTRRIRKGGEYSDFIKDPADTTESEEIKWIKVVAKKKKGVKVVEPEQEEADEQEATTEGE